MVAQQRLPTYMTQQPWLERIARTSWFVTVSAVVFGVIAGTITITTGIGDEHGIWPSPDYRPPLFFILANGLYALAILMSFASLTSALLALKHRDLKQSGYHLLRFLAPITIYIGFFEGSHYIGCTGFGWLCRGGEFTGSMHLLHHTLSAALPLTVLFALGLHFSRPRRS